jgi:type IV secretory pathway VirB2 component (pilin)
MQKLRALKVTLMSAVLMIVMAVPAFAQTGGVDTPGEVVDAIKGDVTSYVPHIIGLVLALFGATLILLFVKKGARAGRGALSKA